MNIKSVRLALEKGGNPEYPAGTGSSVNLNYGLNPHQDEATSAADTDQFQRPASERPADINISIGLDNYRLHQGTA
jgi:hypothetical protein